MTAADDISTDPAPQPARNLRSRHIAMIAIGGVPQFQADWVKIISGSNDGMSVCFAPADGEASAWCSRLCARGTVDLQPQPRRDRS